LDRDNIRIGTSGWSYKEWERVFYPDSKTPKLSYYSSVFNTAEIDSTFYTNPSKGMVLGWVKNTPKDFEFSVKLPQTITHKKKLDLRAGAEIDLLEFLDLIDPLREAGKLGPLLIQLPPSFSKNNLDDLEEFLKSLPHNKKHYMFAIEFRNKSWLNEVGALNRLLSRHNVARTVVDEPLLPVDLTPTADFSFIRWHGRGSRPWYNYRYNNEEIEPWTERVKEQAQKTKKVYGYFNNHFHGYAVENSLEFLKNLGIATEKQKDVLSGTLDFIEGKRKEGTENISDRKLLAAGQKTLGEF
jgi:uncharacterized protein YecE (DUF72 family)